MAISSVGKVQAATVASVAGRTGDVTLLKSDVSGLVEDLAAKAAGPSAIVVVAATQRTPLGSNATFTSTPFNGLNVGVFGASPVASWEWQFQGSQSVSGTLYCSPTGQAGTWTVVRTLTSSAYAGGQAVFDRGPVPVGSPWLQLIVTNGGVAQSAPMLIFLRVEGTPTV